MNPWLQVAACGVVYAIIGCSVTPPLASNLPTADPAGEFDRRIQSRFAIGSLETDMVSELIRQGFMPSADRGDTASKHVYSFEKSRFPCTLIWNVVWMADSYGAVTMINGIYFASCP